MRWRWPDHGDGSGAVPAAHRVLRRSDEAAPQHPLVRGARRRLLQSRRVASDVDAEGASARDAGAALRAVASAPRTARTRAARSAVSAFTALHDVRCPAEAGHHVRITYSVQEE